MENGSNKRPEHKHEFTLFSLEEFEGRFNNFYLVFTIEDTLYKPLIRQFLQNNYPTEFEKIRQRFQESGLPRVEAVRQNTAILYKMYLALRNEGGFSNRELDLIYW